MTSLGRLSQKKLSVAVSRVLSAWTAWSVYTPIFIDHLQDRFEGKETKPSATEAIQEEEEDATEEEEVPTIGPDDAALVSTHRKGTWQEVDKEIESQTHSRAKFSISQKTIAQLTPSYRDRGDTDGDPVNNDGESWDADGELLDAEGEPVDPDGEALDGEALDADGEALDGDPVDFDGEALDGETVDADGEPLDADGDPLDADGEHLEVNGEVLYTYEIDRDPMDADGESADVDGEVEGDPDGEPL
jgi:U2-associated protein SR140